MSSSSALPPGPTPAYGEGAVEDDDLHGPAPTQVTMVTEEAFPYATAAESHYAKEDTDSMQARRAPLLVGLERFSSSSFVTAGPRLPGDAGWR